MIEGWHGPTLSHGPGAPMHGFFLGLWPSTHNSLFSAWSTGDKPGQSATARNPWVVFHTTLPLPFFVLFMILTCILQIAHLLLLCWMHTNSQADCNHADLGGGAQGPGLLHHCLVYGLLGPGSRFQPSKFSSPTMLPLNFLPPSIVSLPFLLQGAEVMCSSLGEQPEGAGMEMRLGSGCLQSLWQTFQPQSTVPAKGAALLSAQQRSQVQVHFIFLLPDSLHITECVSSPCTEWCIVLPWWDGFPSQRIPGRAGQVSVYQNGYWEFKKWLQEIWMAFQLQRDINMRCLAEFKTELLRTEGKLTFVVATE